jgi:hypothetical protein
MIVQAWRSQPWDPKQLLILLKTPQAFFSFFSVGVFRISQSLTALNFPPHDFGVLNVDGTGQAKSRRIIVAHPAPKRARCKTVEPAKLGRERTSKEFKASPACIASTCVRKSILGIRRTEIAHSLIS